MILSSIREKQHVINLKSSGPSTDPNEKKMYTYSMLDANVTTFYDFTFIYSLSNSTG